MGVHRRFGMMGRWIGAIAWGSSAALLGTLAGATPALATPQVTEFRVPGPGGASTGIAIDKLEKGRYLMVERDVEIYSEDPGAF